MAANDYKQSEGHTYQHALSARSKVYTWKGNCLHNAEYEGYYCEYSEGHTLSAHSNWSYTSIVCKLLNSIDHAPR